MKQNVVPFPQRPARPPTQDDDQLRLGCGYPRERFATMAPNYPEGLVGDYSISPMAGEIVAPTPQDTQLFVADGDHLGGLTCKGNSLQLLNASTEGPEVTEAGLTMQMDFLFQFDTSAAAAQLGVVHLVQSQRALHLADGSQRSLLDTSTPVLYLHSANIDSGVEAIGDRQPPLVRREQGYHLRLTQVVPDEVEGVALESLTVLEQYQTYFLQRPEGESAIWTSVLAPITWGWSIRVGRRVDGPWGIVRRKLILPSVGHDGLELPQWQGNTTSV